MKKHFFLGMGSNSKRCRNFGIDLQPIVKWKYKNKVIFSLPGQTYFFSDDLVNDTNKRLQK